MAAGILDKIKFQSPNNEPIMFQEPNNDRISDDLRPDDELDPDPAPEEPEKPARKPRAKPGPKTGTLKFRKEVAAEIQVYIDMVALTWSVRDDFCASALSASSAAIAESLVDVLSRYPNVLEKLRGTAVFGDAFGLLMALKPVAMAIKSHHFDKTLENIDGAHPVNPDVFPAWGSHASQTGAMGHPGTRVFQSMGPTPGHKPA